MKPILLKGLLTLTAGGIVGIGVVTVPALTKSSEESKEYKVTKTSHQKTNFDCAKGEAKITTDTSIETTWRSGEDSQSVLTQQQKTDTEKRQCEGN